ncbi:hypothetical protein AAVH_21881 [Aphelenchoides avenae]|nr:hypothetical protein AAVH_21881 [Aphelenchus avenae]
MNASASNGPANELKSERVADERGGWDACLRKRSPSEVEEAENRARQERMMAAIEYCNVEALNCIY